MSVYTTIEKTHWKRKDHFDFFQSMDQPFFGITTNVTCGRLFHFCEAEGQSFFAHYLFRCIHAVNAVENFKYRVIGNDVVQYDTIHASSTILRKDETFGFSFLPFTHDFKEWCDCIASEKAAVENEAGLRHNEDAKRQDMIHFSALPWLSFTSMTHPSHPAYKGSVPKISIGAAREINNDYTMPISVDVHHGLVDGLHVSRFINFFQELL